MKVRNHECTTSPNSGLFCVDSGTPNLATGEHHLVVSLLGCLFRDYRSFMYTCVWTRTIKCVRVGVYGTYCTSALKPTDSNYSNPGFDHVVPNKGADLLELDGFGSSKKC